MEFNYSVFVLDGKERKREEKREGEGREREEGGGGRREGGREGGRGRKREGEEERGGGREEEGEELTCGNKLGMNRLPKPSMFMSNSTKGGQAPVPNPDRIPSRGVVMETRLWILANDRGCPTVLDIF